MSNKKEDYFIYSHNNPNVKTMGDFVGEADSIGIGLNIAQLLVYQDENNQSNIDNLSSLYDQDEVKKFQSLIDQIKNTKPQQDQNNAQIINNTTAEGLIKIDTSQQNLSSVIDSKNVAQLNDILYDKEEIILYGPDLFDETIKYFTYTYRPQNLFHLNKLYSNEVKLLFKKFIYRIEIETDYIVLITDSLRTQEAQNHDVATGKSNSKFSYHLVGLALDINLLHKTNSALNLTKASPNSAWYTSKVIGIANDLGLIWGGTFANVERDPVHFDAQHYFNVHKQRYLDSVGEPVVQSTVKNNEIVLSNSSYLDLPIKIGTVIAIPLKEIDRSILSTETNQTINAVNFEGFLARQLVDLLSDTGYKRLFKPKSQAFKGDVQEIYPYISVWVWSRALSISSTNESDTEDKAAIYEHRIINITPYISALNTNVAENGGSFNFNLAPITADLRAQNKQEGSFTGKGWKVKEGTQKASPLNKGDYVNQSHIHYIEKDELKRNRMYFEKVLQANDLVFIRFERLELEDKRKNLDELETISINDLPNQIFDMIGLIDNVQQTSNFDKLDVDIVVSGRDLVKLLIEDGVYLYPTDFTADGIFSNTGATNTRLFRFDGNYLSRFSTLNKTIDRSLKFIINNLGTIEICPQDLFDGYANCKESRSSDRIVDKRSKAYQLTDNQKQELEEQQHINDDDKDKILEKISRIRKINHITESSDGEVFNTIKNFLSDRINAKEIIAINQKIQSWTNVENNITYKNKLPNLDKEFIISDRVWLGFKNGLIVNPNSYPAIETIETIYRAKNKTDLAETSVDSVKELVRQDGTKIEQNRYFLDIIPFKQIIADIDAYVKTPLANADSPTVFTANDVNVLNTVYQPTILKGKSISLGVVAKKITDLTKDEKEVFDNIYNLIVNQNGQNKQSVNETLQPLAGIWQIIKLVIDDSVKDRRLVDSTIGNESGSIINAFRKICQDPFCEFFTDTYGDQFYFIARKKPFDQQSILSMLDGQVAYNQPDPIDTSKVSANEAEFQDSTGVPPLIQQKNLIIDIEETDVLSDSLNYSTEAYSWYRLQLANLSGGDASSMAWAYLKGVYFNEFADIYGSKPLDLTTSYVPYMPIIDKNTKLPNAYFIRQGIYDLKYMIECSACLPFTRMGVIVMNGDRRIKRGTFIRYKGTGEIFYVDAVSHSFSISGSSIERTTTLQVSRGMVERFIRGVNISNTIPHSRFPALGEEKTNTKLQGGNVDLKEISYFNICQLDIDETIFTNADKGYSDFSKASTAGWKVNRSVFNFFLKKLQFAKNDKEIFDALQ